MKCFAVCGWLLGTGPSGANGRLHGLLAALGNELAADEQVIVLHDRRFVPVDGYPGIEWLAVRLGPGPAWHRALRERRMLPPLLRSIRADLLELGLLPVPAALPCPVSLTIHDLRDLGPHGRRPPWLARRVLVRSLARAAAVTVPSRYTAAALRAAAPAAPRLAVIPNAPDARLLGLERRPAAAPFLLHVGHLERRKNLDLLLRAFADLRDPGVQLVLAGRDGGEGRRLRRRARQLGLAKRVGFAGAVTGAELRALYASCHAVVLPSRYEGFGLPAVEAIAAGVPVLVSDAAALPEVVGTAGTIVPVDDVAAWTRALAAALAAPTSAAGRSPAALPTWSAAARQTVGLWREILAGDQRHRRPAETDGDSDTDQEHDEARRRGHLA